MVQRWLYVNGGCARIHHGPRVMVDGPCVLGGWDRESEGIGGFWLRAQADFTTVRGCALLLLRALRTRRCFTTSTTKALTAPRKWRMHNSMWRSRVRVKRRRAVWPHRRTRLRHLPICAIISAKNQPWVKLVLGRLAYLLNPRILPTSIG
jgi:hypothetical protein